MGDKIMASRQEDVPMVWIHEGLEYSHRLITKWREGCESFSFHITTYMPNFETDVVSDDHEVVLFCLKGESRQILQDGTEIHFTPGTATYLPRKYVYHHIVGPEGLVVAVACNPPRE